MFFNQNGWTTVASYVVSDVAELFTDGGYALSPAADFGDFGLYNRVKLKYLVNAPAGQIAQTVWGSGEDCTLNLYVGDELLGAFPVYCTSVEGHAWCEIPVERNIPFLPTSKSCLLATVRSGRKPSVSPSS